MANEKSFQIASTYYLDDFKSWYKRDRKHDEETGRESRSEWLDRKIATGHIAPVVVNHEQKYIVLKTED